MKKKILLIITIVLTISLMGVLSACASAAAFQRIISDTVPWKEVSGTELATYKVTQTGSDLTGTYTTNVTKYTSATSIVIGNETIDNFKGFVATSNLVFDNILDSINTEVAFSLTCKPIKAYQATFTESTNKTEVILGDYSENKKYQFTTYTLNNDVEENKVSGSISHKEYSSSPFYDNAMLYQLARCVQTAGRTSVAFSVPSVNLNALDSVNININTTEVAVKLADNETEVNCVTATINTTRNFPGTYDALTCYIANHDYSDAKLKAVIVKIVEGNMNYTLENIQMI